MEDCHIRGMPTLGELPHKGICTYLQHDMNSNVLFQYILGVNLFEVVLFCFVSGGAHCVDVCYL